MRQRVRELAQDLRIGQLIGCLHMGNLPEETAAENTYLFGTQVIPHLRDLLGRPARSLDAADQPAAYRRPEPGGPQNAFEAAE